MLKVVKDDVLVTILIACCSIWGSLCVYFSV